MTGISTPGTIAEADLRDNALEPLDVKYGRLATAPSSTGRGE
jgi:hypothetical protein